MPMSIPELERALRSLRLSGMIATLEARALQVAHHEMDFLEALSALVQDELDRRHSRLLERRHALSGLPDRKDLHDFDWSYNPRLPKRDVLELATLHFIDAKEDVLLLGPPGTDKSHVAKALATSAVQRGHKVLYREAHQLIEDITEARQLGDLAKLRAQQSGPVVEGPVGGEDGGGLLVAGHEDVGQFVAGVGGELSEEEIVEQEQVGAAYLGSELAEVAELTGLGDVLDELVGLAIEDLEAALDGGGSEGFGNVALAGAGRADDEDVLLGVDELQGGEFEYVAPGQAGVVGPVEALEVLVLGQTGEGVTPLEQTGVAAIELVLDEPGEGFEEVRLVTGHLKRTRLEGGDHAGEAEVLEGAFKLGDRHGHRAVPPCVSGSARTPGIRRWGGWPVRTA